jgi:predicted dienelactone hydrolase
MMKRLIALLAFTLAPIAGTADQLPGFDRLDLRSAHRANPIATSLWYPAGSRTYISRVGDNILFKGTPVMLGAKVAEGQFPLVLMSHGSGGNMETLGWLAGALAQRGAIVLAVNHPGSTSGDSSPRRSVDLASRAADLSGALDAVLADPNFSGHVDVTRIYSLGFSLGGATALNLAGMRLDATAYAPYCADMDKLDCQFFAKGGVDFARLPAGFSADMTDMRVAGAIAIDPGFTFVATDDSLKDMTLPVHLISLGKEHLLPATDLSDTGSGLVARLPNATHATFSPASHFTFLAECKPGGAEILREEGDDPICTDPAETDRAQVHDDIIRSIAEFLKL